MNTDGSPVYKSTKNSLWPIQFRINEFPPEKRFLSENLMSAGLWFGKKEPNMQVFKKPFVQEMYDLYHNGFSWLHHEEVIETKVITLNCVVDSIAKPTLQGTTQFNGYFGCNYCYHPGDLIDNWIRYCSDKFDDKTDVKIREEMLFCTSQSTTVSGVKRISPLYVLPNFDLVNGFVIDYMHAVLLGVAKLTVTLWTDSKSYNSPLHTILVKKLIKFMNVY
ncbi:hypothetical protein JTE90_021740 [Oedothorax gibbosus]|uniref:Uncharacterized protein n=1 Tax=Oedothorax gibbosus TaxID=931172 RepID=A0AAV6UFS0_9ARAC|nr:hypothetical protein JTE90_021740 [Oedothorax gibbosus]